MKKILLLDADRRSALALARSLASSGRYSVDVAGASRLDICRFSRSVHQHHFYHSPRHDVSAFKRSLEKLVEEIRPDLIVPCTDFTATPICSTDLYDNYRDRLALADRSVYMATSDKRFCTEVARTLGIPLPNEYEEDSLESATFPLIVKPRYSWYVKENRMLRADRIVCSDRDELAAALAQVHSYDSNPLIQECVPGKGYGQFFAVKNGEIIAEFAHERVREIPPSGGYSSLRKSIAPDPVMRDYSRKLLAALNWTGIAMVEFKGTVGGDLWLMEVNGRPWGSLDLSVSSGLDFPRILVEIFLDDQPADVIRAAHSEPYQIGHFSKWLPGDIKYLKHVMGSGDALRVKLSKSLNVFRPTGGKTSFDTFRANDPLPHLVEVFQFALKLMRKR